MAFLAYTIVSTIVYLLAGGIVGKAGEEVGKRRRVRKGSLYVPVQCEPETGERIRYSWGQSWHARPFPVFWFSVVIPEEMLIKPVQRESCPCARIGDDMSRQGSWEERGREECQHPTAVTVVKRWK